MSTAPVRIPGVSEQEEALAQVRLAAGGLEAAREQLIASLAAARQRGVSLRRLADAAGVSHENVRRMLGEAPQ